jgi:Amt family ammonium transporter
LLYGSHDPSQLWKQAAAAAFIIAYDAIMTFVVLKIVALFVPLRATDAEVEGGDLAIHGIDPVPMYVPPKGAAVGGAAGD